MASSLVIKKELDRASPRLCQVSASGERFPQVILECCVPQLTNIAFYRIKLGNVAVKSLKQTSQELGPNGRPLELATFGYDTITWTYTRLPPSPPDQYASFWDLLHNAGGVLPLPFRLTIRQTQPGEFEISWLALADKTYRVFSGPHVDGPFSLLAEVIPASDGLVTYPVSLPGNAMFFTVAEEPNPGGGIDAPGMDPGGFGDSAKEPSDKAGFSRPAASGDDAFGKADR